MKSIIFLIYLFYGESGKEVIYSAKSSKECIVEETPDILLDKLDVHIMPPIPMPATSNSVKNSYDD
jgi:hypothetical protein